MRKRLHSLFQFKSIKKTGRQHGSTLSEFPPAMFLLLFFALFPVLNLIFLGITFSSCVLLNNLQLREAARTPNSQLPAVIDSLQQNWQSTGIGKFAGVATTPQTEVSYSTVGSEPYVNVSTTFTVKSFLTIPYFKGIPGLGAPLTYTVSGKRVLENPRYAQL